MNSKNVQHSLKTTTANASFRTALLIIAIVALSAGAYYYAAAKVSANSIKKELASNIGSHIERVFPSFLLPEQKGAMFHQIDLIKSQSELTKLIFIESKNDLPAGFKNCTPNTEAQFCSSHDGSEIGILAPIKGGNQLFGYLFETKTINNSYSFQMLSVAALASTIIICLFMLILFALFRKIIGKKMPQDIDALLKYVHDLLQDNPTIKNPSLHFSDFSVLRTDIAKIFTNYKRTQNQAIVGHFATGVLHDLKTQLQSIVTASELAEEAKINPNKYKDRLENLHRVTQQNLSDLQAIINSTLDANKEISLTPQFMNIEETIKHSIALTKKQDEFKDIDIRINKSGDNIFLTHDSTQIVRLFFNLIKNALEAQSIKNSDKDKNVQISINADPDKVLVRVEDSGPGFKVDVSEIFDPFVTTKKYGVGFGLYNAQKIVAAHGWTIAASMSEQLGGACFEVTIPKEANI